MKVFATRILSSIVLQLIIPSRVEAGWFRRCLESLTSSSTAKPSDSPGVKTPTPQEWFRELERDLTQIPDVSGTHREQTYPELRKFAVAQFGEPQTLAFEEQLAAWMQGSARPTELTNFFPQVPSGMTVKQMFSSWISFREIVGLGTHSVQTFEAYLKARALESADLPW